jgi:transcriptional regulator with XRE-family HTH domain
MPSSAGSGEEEELALTAEERRALGKRISRRRKALDRTQEDLAGALDVHKQTVWKWENGTVAITLDNLRRLAAQLETTPAELLGSAPSPAARNAGHPPVEIDYGQAMFWLGRLYSDVRTVDSSVQQLLAVRDSLTALADLIRSATGSMADFVNSGVLGEPPGPAGPAPITPDDVLRKVAATMKAEQERDASKSA